MQQVFDFTLPGDYTYDAALVAFVAGNVKLLDRRPAGATFYANYGSGNEDGRWENGDATGTLLGGATVSGGYLNVDGAVSRACDYDADANADSQQQGCIRIVFQPQYNGSPAVNMMIACVTKGNGDTTNMILLHHRTDGTLRARIRDENDNLLTNVDIAFVAVSGTDYEIELNWRMDGGDPNWWLYLDGVLQSTSNTEGTRSAEIELLRIGNNANNAITSDVKIRQVLIFNAAQHTGANYTPDWSTIYDDVYSASNPTVQANDTFLFGCLTSFVETAAKPGSDEVKYQFQFEGNWYWHNGASWVVSDGTYAQANTAAELNATTCCYLCEQVGEGAYGFRTLLHSADGTTTPVLDQVVINFDQCPAPIPPEPPTPEPDLPDFLTQSSSPVQRGPNRRRERGRPWRRYWPDG